MKEVLETVIEDLVNNFNFETLQEFFYLKVKDRWKEYREPLHQYEDDFFVEVWRVGEFDLKNNTHVGVYTVAVEKELTERSSKKRQFELAKKVLKDFPDAGFFVFHDNHGNFRFSLVYSIYRGTKRQFSYYKRYTYYVSPELTNKTFRFALRHADLTSLDKIIEAFSLEKVTEEFFEAYKYALKEVIIKSLSKYKVPYEKKHSFAQQLLSRILFVYFIQRKGWFKWKDYIQDKSYIKNLWFKYKDWKKKSNQKNHFYSQWLSSLFFGAFNRKSHLIHKELPEEIKESFRLMPFLNGGLFSRTELDELGFDVPDYVFEWLFEPDDKDKKKGFLEIFNFTIDESSPIDIEVAVDPEMLGKVYESLIAEEERGSMGIFYTPRVEIDFMCRLSLASYLEETGIEKEKIINFVFEPHNEELNSGLSIDELRKIKLALDKVKIVDPAVGSASFLVSMLNILVELHSELTKRLERKEENLFALKNKIISENLYGVDVKDWAVMVGELRLWLNLIVETDEKYMDIYTKPLLPNLTFKLRQGDSLIEEIAGLPVRLRFDLVVSSVKQKIVELSDKKAEYFSGQRSADLKEKEEIERLEQELFKEIINLRINELKGRKSILNQELHGLTSQKNFEWEAAKDTKKINKIKSELSSISEEINRWQKILSQIDSKTKKEYFLWEIDFAEVFYQKGGFDIVIGNPPYVRQELIAPPLERKDNYTDDQWRKIKKQYKERLIQSVKNVWGSDVRIDKKSDLYVYFYYQGLSLLRKGGIFCFINSNSWLDVGYGAGLQEFLLKNMEPILIIDNLKKRSFKQADVNTVIVLIRRPAKKVDNFTLKFVAFKKGFEDVLNAEVVKKIERADKPIFDDEDFRLYPKTKKELLLEGIEKPGENREIKFEPEDLTYIGNKWGGKYLRAPEIYFKILEKGKGKLVRLGDIAEVKFGIKTGANEFFYLKPVGMTVKEVVEIAEKDPYTLIRVQNSAGWEGEIEAEFLKPVVKSPRELKTIVVRLEDLNYLVFMCHKSKKELKETKALEYIKWGEKQGYNNRPTCRGREKWWDLGEWEYPDMIWSDAYNDRFATTCIKGKIFADKRFFYIYPINAQNFKGCKIYLNTTIIPLFIEVEGISNLGEGVIYTNVYWLKRLPVLNDSTTKAYAEDLLRTKKVESIFTELGFDPNKPIREQKPNPLPDRKALDDIIFDALGLTEEERKEVYWSVAELVKNRLEKARSV